MSHIALDALVAFVLRVCAASAAENVTSVSSVKLLLGTNSSTRASGRTELVVVVVVVYV